MIPVLEFRPYEDIRGQWRWQAVDTNGKIVADSAEAYSSKQAVEEGLRNIFDHFEANAVDVVWPDGAVGFDRD